MKSENSESSSSKAPKDRTAMNFEIQNRKIRLKWFKYDTITAMLTFAGLVTVCIGKYHAIYLLKNECLEKTLSGCE